LAACGSPQQNQIVPVASSGPGAQGSYWTTAIWLSDPGATPGEDTVVTGFAVDYLDLSTTHERQYTVPSNGTLEIADVIESLGLPTGRTFWVYFWGYKAFSVNARIYTTEAEGNGTYGQHVPVTYEDQGMAQGDIITFPVPLDYSRYRVNVGFTYGNGATTRLRLSVVRGDGTEASSQTVTLTGYQSVQLGAVNAALAGAAAGKVVIEALDDTGEDVFPYVSVVDMTTSDPVFLFYHTPCLP
jgi:hypothetical protein